MIKQSINILLTFLSLLMLSCTSYDAVRNTAVLRDDSVILLPPKTGDWYNAEYPLFNPENISTEMMGSYFHKGYEVVVGKDQTALKLNGNVVSSCQNFFIRGKSEATKKALAGNTREVTTPKNKSKITEVFPDGSDENDFFDQILIAERKSENNPGLECGRIIRITKHSLLYLPMNSAKETVKKDKDITDVSQGWYLFTVTAEALLEDFRVLLAEHVRLLTNERSSSGEVREFRLNRERDLIHWVRLLRISPTEQKGTVSKYSTEIKARFFKIKRSDLKDEEKQIEYDQALDIYAQYLEI